MNKKETILLAEDDAALAFMIKDSLEDLGYNVMHCKDGQTAIQMFVKDKTDLCILDIMMPRRDGYQVAKKIRAQSDRIPILFLSTKNQEQDRLKGYESGADDYLAKPFSMPELQKKIEIFLRRSRKTERDTVEEYHLGNIVFKYDDLQLITPDETYKITQKEASLMLFLCEHQNTLVKREEILLEVWGKDDFFLGRSMDVYMTKLRKMLRSDPNLVLETIHGVGFRFLVPEKVAE